MEDKYLQGKVSLLAVTIEGNLYELSNGNVIRVYSMCDDPEYEYGYDYFDGHTQKLVDGGVFNLDATSEIEVLKEALSWCDIKPEDVTWSLIGENIEYSDLEEMGYTGF